MYDPFDGLKQATKEEFYETINRYPEGTLAIGWCGGWTLYADSPKVIAARSERFDLPYTKYMIIDEQHINTETVIYCGEEMYTCPQCGKLIPMDMNFCGYCGKYLNKNN